MRQLITTPIFRNDRTKTIIGVVKQGAGMPEEFYWQKMSKNGKSPIHICTENEALERCGCESLDDLERKI